MNVLRRHEPIATDTVCTDYPAIGTGQTAAQVLIGRKTHVIDIFGVRTDAEFVNTLLDVIHKRGAMDHLISDLAAAELSTRIKDALRALVIGEWQSEAYLHHQNFAERECQDIKAKSDLTLDRSGAPPGAWLLCFKYVAFIMDRTAVKSLNYRTPLGVLTGQTPDISILPQYSSWGPVYIKRYESQGGKSFPSKSNGVKAHFAGYAESVGHSMTYVAVTDDTQQVMSRSRSRRIKSDSDKDLRVGPVSTSDEQEIVKDPSRPEDTTDVIEELDDGPPVIIKSKRETDKGLDESPLPTIDPSGLIGRTFLKPKGQDGTRLRATIVSLVDDIDKDLAQQPGLIRLRCLVGDQQIEEIIAYDQIGEFIERQTEVDEGTWKYRAIIGHQGPLTARNKKEHRGSPCDLLIEWETGECAYGPLHIFYKGDPVDVALCARDNDLIEEFHNPRTDIKRILKREKKMPRTLHQARLRSYRTAPICMCGYEVPRNHQQAVEIDRKNGNSNWQEAERLELSQTQAFGTFQGLGHGTRPPPGHKKITAHFVYAVKHEVAVSLLEVAARLKVRTPLGSPRFPAQHGLCCSPGLTTGSSAAPPSPLPLPPPPSRPISTPAENFQRGIKRDITHYEEFKRNDQWDEWSRPFIAMINMHGCKNVINPRYVAGTNDAQELFDSQQEFVHTIFIKVLKTDYGRSLVRRYEISKDSQRIWESLKLCCTDSMISVHRAQQLMKKINSFRIPEMGRTKGIDDNRLFWKKEPLYLQYF